MNAINSLVIKGEIVAANHEQFTLAYQEEKKDAISVYYFKVKYPVSKKSFVKIGNEVYIAGSLKQNILNDEVYISAENIMLVKEASSILENE